MIRPLEDRPAIQRKPTVLYRLYTADAVLLYVGITHNWQERRRAHLREKHWWQLVAWEDIEPYPNRPTALDAEYEAIKYERPVFNIVGDTGKPQGRDRR